MHYIIDVENKNKILVEDISRKKLRRIARKKYSKEYHSSIVIISGEDYRDALDIYKSMIAKQNEDKRSSSSKTKTKTKIAKKKEKKVSKKISDKKLGKKLTSMLDEAINKENKENRKINRKLRK